MISIGFKIVEAKGPQEHEMPLEQAISVIKNHMEENGMFLHIDGNTMTNSETLSINDLANARDLVLTHRLVGGKN